MQIKEIGYISKTTKTQKQGNGERKQLRETKRNVAGLQIAKKRMSKRKAKPSEVEQAVKEGHDNDAQAVAEFKVGEGEGWSGLSIHGYTKYMKWLRKEQQPGPAAAKGGNHFANSVDAVRSRRVN